MKFCGVGVPCVCKGSFPRHHLRGSNTAGFHLIFMNSSILLIPPKQLAVSAPSSYKTPRGFSRFVFRISMPPVVRIQLVDKMATVEWRLAYGTSEKLQLGALVGAFAEARQGIVDAAVDLT